MNYKRVLLLMALAVALSVMAFVSMSFLSGSSPFSADAAMTEYQHPNAQNEVSVVSATPQGLVENRDQLYAVVVVFNQPMVPLEALPEGDGSGPLMIQPALSGKYRWQGTHTLVFVPSNPLPLASRFTVTIPSGLRALSGAELRTPYSWSFETMRPRVQYVSIPDQVKDISTTPNIYVLFNLPIRLDDVQKNTSLTSADGRMVSIRISRADSQDMRSFLSTYYSSSYDEENREWQKQFLRQLIKIQPSSPLQKSTTYFLSFREGILAEEGTLGLAEPYTTSWTTHGEFAVAFVEPPANPGDLLTIRFTTPVDASVFSEKMTITPKAEMKYIYNYWGDANTLQMLFDLRPQTTYTLRIDPSLTDEFDQELKWAFQHKFTVGDYTPVVHFESGTHIVESYAGLNYYVWALNPKSVNLKMADLDQATLIKLHQSDWTWSTDLDFIQWNFQWSGIPKTAMNKLERVPIDLTQALKQKTSGAVLVEMLHETWDSPRRALIQVTDMSITAKFSRINNLIYVSHLRDASPAADVFLEIRDENGIIRWQGKTDANGFAKTPGWQELGILPANEYSEPRQWIFARKGSQVAYAYSEEKVELWRFNIDYSWYPPKEDPVSCYLFTNQGIYRPGDRVYIKGLVRRLKDNRWTVPSGEPLTLDIMNPNYESVLNRKITANVFGAFDLEYDIDPNAPLGFFSIRVFSGQNQIAVESFQAQEFRPVESEVTVLPDKKSYVWGDKLKSLIEARYLFGAPMGNADIHYSVTRSFMDYQPPGYDEYFFGTLNEEDYYYRGYGYYGYSATLISERKTLDARGQLPVQIQLKHDNHPETSQLLIEGTVTDKNRQTVSGRASVIVHAGEFYIGLKPSSTFHEAGKPLITQVITVSPEGDKVNGKKIQVELVKREWLSVREKSADGSYEWVSSIYDTVVSRQSVTSGEESLVTFQPAAVGYYLIRASAEDSKGNPIRTVCFVYVTGAGTVGWRMDNQDRIDIYPDKKNYKPGEKARILIKSPYARCRALITVEREGVLFHQSQIISGNAATVEIPIRSDMIPNAFVSVILLQGRTALPKAGQKEDIGKPQSKIGYTTLYINSDENKLKVSLETPLNRFAPGNWVDVDLTVKDQNGKGQPAEVTVYAEDVGVLNLISYRTPDAFSLFYKPRPLAVSTYEGRRFVLDQISEKEIGEKGGIGGGGGEEGYYPAISMRRDFKACAYWNPSVLTDANGKARVRFQLPDNLTAYRIMAVAHTVNSQFGSAEKTITVSKPLMLRPALPRFARAGDEIEAGVLVHNLTGQSGTVNIVAAFEGIVTDDSLKRVVEMKDTEVKEIRFRFKVAQIKNAKVSFKAFMGSFSDGVEITLPFRVPTFTQTVATHNSLIDATRTESITIPSSIYADASLLEIRTSSTAMTGLADGVQYLFEYPYGCLEQKTSRVLPILLFADVVRAFDLPAFRPARKGVQQITYDAEPKTMDNVIQEYLNEVPAYQKYNGGFAFWTDSPYESPFVSAYAMLALTKAKQKGYKVNESCYSSGLEYLKKTVRQHTIDRYGLFYWHMTHALSLYVLAENGYYDAPSAEQLFQRRHELPLYARAMLLKAIHRGKGHQAMITELKNQLANSIKMSSTTAHFEEPATSGLEWAFHSDIRTTAAILEVFLNIDGDKVPWAEKVVRYLIQYRTNGRWRSTQDNLYVFWALATYYSVFEKEIPDFNSQIVMEGRTLLTDFYKGRQTKSSTAVQMLSEFPADRALPVLIRKNGSGRLYYTLRMTYVPKRGLTIQPRDEGIKITRVYETMNGETVKDGKFKAGEMYRVKLTVSTPQTRHFVVLEDPLPAGFEAINTDLATASSLEKNHKSRSGYEPFWSTFHRSELRDDRVLMFADYLERGTYTVSYLVRATTYGTFEVPPAKAEEMYAPEVSGNTGNLTIVIR